MRVLIDSGCYDCVNMGDVAMLQVAINRVGESLPGARIQVITGNSNYLANLCPKVEAIPVSGKRSWLTSGNLLGRFHGFLPKGASDRISGLNRALRRRAPSILEFAVRLNMKARGISGRDLQAFLRAFTEADLLLICGQGGLTDHARSHAMDLLGLVEMGIARRIPVAMMGQGIGPIEDYELAARAKAVLPRVTFLALREARAGLPLLRSLGADMSRVVTTGDDAIELAYDARPAKPGSAIGVNLRVARSAAVAADLIDRIGPVLREAAEARGALLLPVPVGRGRASQDPATIRRLLTDIGHQSDGGESLDTPLKVIEQVARCRVVVTGAYHAAVFALSQGIPAVCMARSQYFVDKFLGLKEQFGIGCEVIFLDAPLLQKELAAAIDKVWRSANQLRQPLLEAARRQVQLGQKAYRRVCETISPEGAGSLHQARAAYGTR